MRLVHLTRRILSQRIMMRPEADMATAVTSPAGCCEELAPGRRRAAHAVWKILPMSPLSRERPAIALASELPRWTDLDGMLRERTGMFPLDA
jgi:hypothetical protein